MKRYLTSLIVILTFSGVNAQNVLELTSEFEGKTLVKEEIYWFEDENQTYNFLEVDSKPELFSPLSMVSPNFGNSNSTFWIKIKLQKSSLKRTSYFLDISYPTLDSVYLLHQNKSGQWESTLSGDLIPISKRPFGHRHIVFSLPIYSQDVTTFYLKVRSKGSILIPLSIYNDEALRVSQVKEESFYFFYYGILAVMILYNFFLFLSLRDSNYLLYSITILLNMGFQACLLGHTLLIWGDALWWINISITVSIFTFLSILLIFVLNFLEIKKYSITLYWGLSILAFIWGVMALLSFVVDYGITSRVVIVAASSTCVIIFLSSLYIWIKGRTSARFFVVAWFVYLVGAVTMASRNAGILPDIFFTRQGILIGSMIEVVTISLALADKINIYRREKQEAQAKNIELIQNQKTELEQKVKERTKTLQQKQNEILTQNEELLQKQEELNTQREFIEQRNQELQFKNTQIQYSIRAAEDIQKAVLPSETKISSLFSDYFVFYKPRDIVSGDFYWLTQRDNTIWMVVADCTGHGVPGAFMTLLGSSLIDKIINSYQLQTPAEVLDKLNTEVREALDQEEKRGHQGMDAAIVKLEYQADNGIDITFSGARSHLYIYSPSEALFTLYKGNRANIGGIHRNRSPFKNQTIKTQRGSRLFFSSDGFQDQHNMKRKSFGSQNFRKLLERIAGKPFPEQRDILDTTLANHMIGTDQRDDILLIGVEV